MYSRYVSRRAPGVPSGVETDPREVFARMFGDPQGDFYRRSVLDTVGEDARRLRMNLGQGDQRRLDEYLESVPTLERQAVIVTRPDWVIMKQQSTQPNGERDFVDCGAKIS